jgi:aminopeptidase N
MTDRLATLELLVDEDTPARAAALAHFHDTYKHQPNVLHKWLYVQAASDIENNVANVRALMQHPSFDITDPAAVSALLGGFSDSMLNFHAEDGSGYAFIADAVAQVGTALCYGAVSLCCWPSTHQHAS